MKLLTRIILFLFMVGFGHAQKSIEKTLRKFNKESVPYIHVEELQSLGDILLLDTRKEEEYRVSHIKDAMWVGHKKFEIDSVVSLIPNKNTPIVVYCSIGVRSENIGEKLLKSGYTNIKNLYGGIFEWKKRGYPVFDAEEKETEKVHAFNRQWGKLLTNAEKVYNNK